MYNLCVAGAASHAAPAGPWQVGTFIFAPIQDAFGLPAVCPS